MFRISNVFSSVSDFANRKGNEIMSENFIVGLFLVTVVVAVLFPVWLVKRFPK